MKLSLVVITLLVSASILAADTIPGGDVSGAWTVAMSPIYVNGEITIPTDSMLTIEPGVEVYFLGHYKFIVDGIIHAVGTAQDSILFTATDPDTGWWGLRFTNAPDGSQLSYCILQYGRAIGGNYLDKRGGAIYARSSRPQITYCSIVNNIAENFGGGIFVDGTMTSPFPTISNCSITNNSTLALQGGGIYFNAGSFDITSCNVSGNISSESGGGIFLNPGATDTIMISNCTISDDSADGDGGGIYIDEGYVFINGCIIANNKCSDVGGGLYCGGFLSMINTTLSGNESWGGDGSYDGGGGLFALGNTVIDSCIITGNIAHSGPNLDYGGGICFDPNAMIDSVAITNSTVADNSSDASGGIACYWATTIRIAYCEISDNNSSGYTGGCGLGGDNVSIDHCTVTGNNASTDYGGIRANSDADITNSIFAWNSPDALYRNAGGAVEYSDFFGNGQDITGNIPSGFGVLNTTNYNGDSCDVYFNIFMDPMFEDTATGDYRLLAGSPCIDAGDPMFAYDPDSTITDMGAHWFDQVGIDEVIVTRTPYYELSCSPNPCNSATCISFGLSKATQINLSLYDITGRLVATLADCDYESGFHEVAFDTKSLSTGIYFYRLTFPRVNETRKLIVLR